MVPGSTLMYGSSFWRVIRRPRDLNSRPREAVVIPFPRLEATPPVTKMNFLCSLTSGFDGSRGEEPAGANAPAGNPGAPDFSVRGRDLRTAAAQPVEPPQGRGRLDQPRECDGLGQPVQDQQRGQDHRKPRRREDDQHADPHQEPQDVGSGVSQHAHLHQVGDEQNEPAATPSAAATGTNGLRARPGTTSRRFQKLAVAATTGTPTRRRMPLAPSTQPTRTDAAPTATIFTTPGAIWPRPRSRSWFHIP